ncbi:hypothetical protein NDU88_001963 [Pleurodeles waltl]|uniref:Uncharacterized protein n=1 Tax=Pleurodeles waltl TaxID=8319 RepID=A0AAV7M029_PLEWA|nr:hypothetical protein NDU88_001963 [Pleurodeles waltl]
MIETSLQCSRGVALKLVQSVELPPNLIKVGTPQHLGTQRRGEIGGLPTNQAPAAYTAAHQQCRGPQPLTAPPVNHGGGGYSPGPPTEAASAAPTTDVTMAARQGRTVQESPAQALGEAPAFPDVRLGGGRTRANTAGQHHAAQLTPHLRLTRGPCRLGISEAREPDGRGPQPKQHPRIPPTASRSSPLRHRQPCMLWRPVPVNHP